MQRPNVDDGQSDFQSWASVCRRWTNIAMTSFLIGSCVKGRDRCTMSEAPDRLSYERSTHPGLLVCPAAVLPIGAAVAGAGVGRPGRGGPVDPPLPQVVSQR